MRDREIVLWWRLVVTDDKPLDDKKIAVWFTAVGRDVCVLSIVVVITFRKFCVDTGTKVCMCAWGRKKEYVFSILKLPKTKVNCSTANKNNP